MYKLEISLKRVQTFIFEVPRLKAMLGANALVGETMRNVLSGLVQEKGHELKWPDEIGYERHDDCLYACLDSDDKLEYQDDPAALYQKGILARDGGHFIVVFSSENDALVFLDDAEKIIAQHLPGVLFDARCEPFGNNEIDGQPLSQTNKTNPPQETHIFHLPVLQICQETGKDLASDYIKKDKKAVARSVMHRMEKGEAFNDGKTKDVIGLMREILYPGDKKWLNPNDLNNLAEGDYLALIHADGNGIGLRYAQWRENKKRSHHDPVQIEAWGETFFHSMRVTVRNAVVAALKKTFVKNGGNRPFEILMLGGDDLLLICKAEKALQFSLEYARALDESKLADGKPLHVAMGVAIAQASYPLHRLHELTENLASSAKRLYRALPEADRTSVIDWQVVTQSWFADVEESRQASEVITYEVNGNNETLLLTGKPYRVLGESGLEVLYQAAEQLYDPTGTAAARSALRGLRKACEQGKRTGDMAFNRLPPSVKQALSNGGNTLWQQLTSGQASPKQLFYQTPALDIIGIQEISKLGNKSKIINNKHDCKQ